MIDEEAFLHSNFQSYYRNNVLVIPDRIQAREIGFIPFEGTMVRHIGFPDTRYATKFVSENVPKHLYYSTAYYRKPDERNMQGKEWLGAELIFDLDADHLKNASSMTYEQILAEVKVHTMRLVNDYLLGDLGFSEKSLQVFFSGGRGYHVHAHGDDVYGMTSEMRREVANYCRIEGFGIGEYLKLMERSGNNSTGFTVRFNAFLSSFIGRLVTGGEKESAIAEKALGKRRFQKLIRGLSSNVSTGKGFEKRSALLIQRPRRKGFVLSQEERDIMETLLASFKEMSACEIDEPVTTDIHRLIRFPGSLHGKTGLRVMPVEIKDLEKFDPLTSAIPDVFRPGSVEVVLEKDFTMRMNGEDFSLKAGKNSVPTYLALFMVAQRKCKLK
ncbi:MAG: DNA primase catalytic subunit PriS [Candidatus Thermoplasmatota archaeon]|nr:DNA primase catalytic subunit PriS [Candidatus Thermoplasmatota archaeon]